MGSKSTKQTIAHAYYLGMHHVIGHDSITALREVVVGDSKVWTGNVTTNQDISIDAMNCFGGYHSEGGIKGDVSVCFGRSDQTQNGYLVAKLGSTVPAYRGVFATVLKHVYVGTSPYIKYWSYVCEAYHSSWYSAKAKIGNDHNPAHVIVEVLTNNEFGLGYNIGELDLTAFTNAANTLYTEGFGLSFVWSQEQDVSQFLQEIVRHISASVYISPYTGLWTMKLIRNDYTVGALKVFNEDNIIEVVKYDRPSIGETVNEVLLTYTDASDETPRNIKVHDSALISKQGYTVTSTVEYPAITDATLANKIAQRQLTQLSAPLSRVELHVNRDAYNLGLGDAIVWHWDAYDIQEMVLRIVEISYGSTDDRSITLTCVQDVFSIANTIYAPPPPTAWTTPVSSPVDVTTYKLEEFPYQYWALSNGINTESADPGYAMVGSYVKKNAPDALSYKIMAQGPGESSFSLAGVAYFNPTCKLLAAINEYQTTISFYDDDMMDLVVPLQFILIDSEWCQITSVNVTLLTAVIKRGCLDTRPRTHAKDTVCYITDFTVADGESNVRSSPENVYFKFLPSTGVGVLAESAATYHLYTTNYRIKRPYNVARLTVEGLYYPDNTEIYFDLNLNIGWMERGRLVMGDQVFDDSYAGNFAMEAGTTMTINIYNDDTNALIRSITSAIPSDHAYAYSKSQYLTDINGSIVKNLRLEVETSLGGRTSWQKNIMSFTVLFPSLEDPYSLLLETLTPVAYYLMAEYGLVTVIDWSNNGHDAKYYGTPIWDSAILVDGANQPTVKFSGNDGAYTTEKIFSDTSSFTISLWIKLDAVNTGTDQILFMQHAGTTNEYSLKIYEHNGKIYVDKSGGSLMTISWPTVVANTRYFVTYTESAANGGRLYINGSLIGSATRKVYAGTAVDRLCWGYDSTNNTKFMTGLIAALTIDNNEWTSTNISDLYTAGTTAVTQLDDVFIGYGADMFYKMDELSGSTAVDYGSYATNGTFIGSPTLDVEGPSQYIASNRGIDFPNAAKYLRVVDNLAGGHPFTNIGIVSSKYCISFFFKFTGNTAGANWYGGNTVVELRESVGSAGHKIPFSIGFDNGKLVFGRSSNYTTTMEKTVGRQVINDGRWHSCAVNIDTTTNIVELYINGAIYQIYQFTTVTADTSVASNAARLFIGSRPDDSGNSVNSFGGSLSQVSLFEGITFTPKSIRDLFTWSEIGNYYEYNWLPAMSHSNVTFNPAKTIATAVSGSYYKRVMAYIPMTRYGRYVFEASFQGTNSQVGIGITSYKEADALTQYVGQRDDDFGFVFNALGYTNGSNVNYGSHIQAGSPGDVFQFIVNFIDSTTGGILLCRRDNKVPIVIHQNILFTDTDYYVAGWVYDNEELHLNLGDTAFVNSIPPRYTSVDGNLCSGFVYNPNKLLLSLKAAGLDVLMDDTLIKGNTASGNKGVYANAPKSSGRWAFEARASYMDTNIIFGVTTNPATGSLLGAAGMGTAIYPSNGQVYTVGTLIKTLATVPANEWVMICVDLDIGEITFISPTLGRKDMVLPSGTYYPGICNSNQTTTHIQINFGDQPFSNTMIDDCYSWDSTIYQADVNPEIDLSAAITSALSYTPYALYGMNTTPSGTVVPDLSGNVRHGTLNGGMTMGVIRENIKCAVFDGSNDYISLPTTGFANFTSGFTMFVLARPLTNANDAQFIDLAENTTWPNDNFRFGRSGTGTSMYSQVYVAAAVSNTHTSTSTITDGDWKMYCVRQDNTGKIYHYLNGSLVSSNTGTTFLANVTRASNYIGRSHDSGSSYFNGDMCLVGIYDTDIGAAAIAAIFTAIGL